MNEKIDYVIRVLDSPLEVNSADWNALLAQQSPDEVMQDLRELREQIASDLYPG